MKNDKIPIIFGYFSNNELFGWRCDSFGSLSMDTPKIYHYSESQIKTILDNVRSEMNNSTSNFFSKLFKLDVQPMNMEGESLDKDSILELVKEREKEKSQYKDLELRVYPFIGYGENWEYPEKMEKTQAKLNNLDEPLEIHKFTTIENQN